MGLLRISLTSGDPTCRLVVQVAFGSRSLGSKRFCCRHGGHFALCGGSRCLETKEDLCKKKYWGRGLALALCKTALDFVARHQVKKVVLFTSMVQSDAHN